MTAAVEAPVSWRELEDRYDEDLPCEGPTHPQRISGHAPGAAEYRVTYPCCGRVLNMCAGWVTAGANYLTTACDPGGCGAKFPSDLIRVVPI